MIQNKASQIYSLENFINNLEEIVKQSVSVNTHNPKVVSSSLTPATTLYITRTVTVLAIFCCLKIGCNNA